MSSGHSSSTREICGKFENARRLGERGDTRNVLLRVCQRRVQHLLALHQKPRPVDSTVALIRGDKSRPSKITGGCGVSPDTTKHSSAKRLYRGVASTTRLTNAGHVKMRLRHRWPRSERKNRESPGWTSPERGWQEKTRNRERTPGPGWIVLHVGPGSPSDSTERLPVAINKGTTTYPSSNITWILSKTPWRSNTRLYRKLGYRLGESAAVIAIPLITDWF